MRISDTEIWYTPKTRVCAQCHNMGQGVVHMFHGGLWGGWQFQMNGKNSFVSGNAGNGTASDGSSATIGFGYGGYQEARGSGRGK